MRTTVRIALIAMAALLVMTAAFAQSKLTPIWSIKAGTNSWLLTSADQCRGMTYSSTSDHIYVTSRALAANIYILSPATGDSLGKLNVSIVSGGTHTLSRLDAAADSAIYACDLVLDAAAADFKIYRWANESAVPTVAFQGRIPHAGTSTKRYGDAFDVVGSGTSTKIYASGTGNEWVMIFTTADGLTFSRTDSVSVGAVGSSRASLGLASDGLGNIFGNNAGVLLGEWNTTTKALVGEVPASVLPAKAASVDYFTRGPKQFVASLIGDAPAYYRFAIVDISNGVANASLVAITDSVTGNANLNATGRTFYDPVRKRLYALVTNNYLAAFDMNVGFVTFLLNTAAVPDTLGATSAVQVRGGKAPLTWGGDSPLLAQNIGGDYWKVTGKFTPGDTVPFKFFTNAVGYTGENEHKGWEQDIDPGGNRQVIVSASDTTLPLEFVNGTPNRQLQYFVPWVTSSDSIDVWFRVNMQANENFSKNTQFMGVRGGTAPLDWGKSVVLKRETQHGNGGSQQYDGTNFWSGVARFPGSVVGAAVEYKFVVLDANRLDANVVSWEGIDNRRFVPSIDTTLYWAWWSNIAPRKVANKDTVVITFKADLSTAIRLRGYTPGDTVQVRTGYYTTAKELRTKMLAKQGLTGNIYAVTDTIVGIIGNDMDYQYYLVKGGQEYREVYYDFSWTGDPVSRAERRRVNLAGGTLTVLDTSTSNIVPRRQPRFQNMQKLARDVLVTYTCDVRPAIFTVKAGRVLNDIQGNRNVTNPDSILIRGVWMNGPAVGGWGNPPNSDWGSGLELNLTKKMYDDGTHGDAHAHDSIYTLQVQYKKDSTTVGKEFKFGIWAGDNEGGAGGYGNNHIENIDDSQPTATIVSYFGSINPPYYVGWNFDLNKPIITSVEEAEVIPTTYTLNQNYPNPFNPSTTIEFGLPTSSDVTLKVYNLLGEEIATLLHGFQKAGMYKVRFDASRLASGMYFYRITAGSFVATKKMLLMK